MATKLFERLVTKFSIKVNDLAKYLDISKATIYNYRNLENFSDIPRDKQVKIFYLFGKENEAELELVLDESDNEILSQYLNRIANILRESVKETKTNLASIEELANEAERLRAENASLRRQALQLEKLSCLDELTRTILFDRISVIVSGASNAEVKEFLDYLGIFEKYRLSGKNNG